jgi:hypothetical protein
MDWIARARLIIADRERTEAELGVIPKDRLPTADHSLLTAQFFGFDWGYGSWGDEKGNLVLGLPLLIPDEHLAHRWATILGERS